MENVPSDGGSHREKLILQEIDRLVKERDDLRARLNRAEMLIDRLTEENHQMVWLMDRVERAEAVKDSLMSALRGINEIAEVWNIYEFKQICDIAKFALRTAEESSIVGLIDSTPAKHPEDSADTDEDVESLIDDGGGGMSHTPELLRVIEQNELDKTLRCVGLVDSNGVFALAVDEKYGGLIAAAPDMLRALEAVASKKVIFHKWIPSHRELYETVCKAIMKARGEE